MLSPFSKFRTPQKSKKIQGFQLCFHYYLAVYDSVTLVNIIGSLQKGYLMKAF